MLSSKPITLSELITRFDFFLTDIWGVLIDGQRLIPGAVEFLTRLRSHQKKIILISNTPQRNLELQQFLNKLGLLSYYYDGVTTAGETTRNLLINEHIEVSGKNYFYIGPEDTQSLLANTSYHLVDQVEAADFVLLNGYPEPEISDTTLTNLLAKIISRKIPLICTNPDIAIYTLEGKKSYCSGHLAAKYQKMGGNPRYIGKPYPEIYQSIITMFKLTPREKILVIGDNLLTDIAGADCQNLASLLLNILPSNSSDNCLLQPTYIASSLQELL